MPLSSPTQPGGEPPATKNRRTHQYNLPIPYPRIDGDEDGEGVASQTIATVPFAVGGEAPPENQGGVDSDDPDYQPDMRPCPRGCSPLEYCHGHSPTPPSPSPLPIRPRPVQPRSVVNVNLNRAEAARLVDRLSTLIQEDDENTDPLLPAYTPQRVGIRGGRQSRGVDTTTNARAIHIPRPHNERPARSSSPTPLGFEHNRGAAFIPFNITDRQGREVPARYIQVHMTADDPYVLARATITGPIYEGQLHATPVNDVDTLTEPLTDVAMHMFAANFPGRQFVDQAVANIGDCTLTAELKRQWWYAAQIEEAGRERERLERQVFQLGLEQGMSHNRLQEARAGDQIAEEMMRDTRRYTDVPVPQQQRRGRRGRQT